MVWLCFFHHMSLQLNWRINPKHNLQTKTPKNPDMSQDFRISPIISQCYRMGLELSIHPPQPVGSGGTNASGVSENKHPAVRGVWVGLSFLSKTGKMMENACIFSRYMHIHDFSYTGMFHEFCQTKKSGVRNHLKLSISRMETLLKGISFRLCYWAIRLPMTVLH